MRFLRARGWAFGDIATVFGVTYRTAHRVCKDIPPRARGVQSQEEVRADLEQLRWGGSEIDKAMERIRECPADSREKKQQRDDMILKLRESGWNLDEIAKRFELDTSRVSRICKDMDTQAKRDEEILRYAELGLTHRRIAEIVGVARPTVSRVLKGEKE
jgi:plasmid maintenance system antidote protein VapI